MAERVGWFQERSVWLDRQARAEDRCRADNITFAYALTGPVDEGRLARALGLVAGRHLPLRTVYPPDADPPVALVLPEGPVPVRRLRAATAAEAYATVAGQWLDVQSGPVFTATLADCADGIRLLVLAYAHLVADGVESVEIVVRELAECYRALARGEQPALDPPSTSYPEFAAANRSRLDEATRERLLAYWRERLPPLTPDPPVDLPTLSPGSGTRLGPAAVVEVPVPPDVEAALPGLRARFRTTTFVLVLSALLAAARSRSARREVGALFAVDVRARYRAHGLLGSFATLSAVWLPLDPHDTVTAVVRQTRDRIIGGFQHSDLPLDEIIRDAYPEWWEDIESPPYIFFTTGRAKLGRWQAGGLTAEPYRPGAGEPLRHLHPGLKVMLRPEPAGLVLACQHAVEAYSGQVVASLLATAADVLRALAEDPEKPISAFASRHSYG